MFPPGENRGHVHMPHMVFHPPPILLPAEKSAQLGGMYKRGKLVNSIPFGASMSLGMPTLAPDVKKGRSVATAAMWLPREKRAGVPMNLPPRPFFPRSTSPLLLIC